MNLAVTYLGLPLHSPIIVGSAPFCGDLEVCRALEGAGAGALVMGSLFAEQLGPRQPSRSRRSQTTAAPAETDAFLRPGKYQFSPGEYLRQIARLKKCLQIPVVASLNGRASGTWADCARQFEDAGADAIELNPYQVVTRWNSRSSRCCGPSPPRWICPSR